jgi:hypothetical protein
MCVQRGVQRGRATDEDRRVSVASSQSDLSSVYHDSATPLALSCTNCYEGVKQT